MDKEELSGPQYPKKPGGEHLNARWKHIGDVYGRFVDGKGFAVLVTLCVAVIAGTAVWTGNVEKKYVKPELPLTEEKSASVLLQQSIHQAITPTPLPSVSDPVWHSPLPELHVVRSFSTVMKRSGVTGIWSIHEGVDLAADTGDPVSAIADGTVVACGENALDGIYVEIRHAQGCVSRYAGLTMSSALQSGDLVHAGQTVGFVGNGMIGETDLGPHLHLELQMDGEAVDPIALLQ